MLIRCCDCTWNKTDKCPKVFFNGNPIVKCNNGIVINKDLSYRYELVDYLHLAVLNRLLDPKNVAKGEFSRKYHELLNCLTIELGELDDEFYKHFDGDAINVQRIIEECGDVGAYLAAIIDAVGNNET